jgi:hypothetical protein
VVFEPQTSAACSGQARAREEREEVVEEVQHGTEKVLEVPLQML